MASKLIFMGTPEFSVPALQLLNLKHEIISVYTQPPKKKSRGQKNNQIANSYRGRKIKNSCKISGKFK